MTVLYDAIMRGVRWAWIFLSFLSLTAVVLASLQEEVETFFKSRPRYVAAFVHFIVHKLLMGSIVALRKWYSSDEKKETKQKNERAPNQKAVRCRQARRGSLRP